MCLSVVGKEILNTEQFATNREEVFFFEVKCELLNTTIRRRWWDSQGSSYLVNP